MSPAPAQTTQQICRGVTRNGSRCRRPARPGEQFCSMHMPAEDLLDSAVPPRVHDPESAPRSRDGIPDDVDRAAFDEIRDQLEQESGSRSAGDVASTMVEAIEAILTGALPLMGDLRDLIIRKGLVEPAQVDSLLADGVEALTALSAAVTRRMSGEYEEDDFGFDAEFTEALKPLFRLLYKYYWRVETIGIENVPAQGPALLVSNHAGTLPWDGAMVKMAIFEEHPQPRHARVLVLDWLMSLPWLGEFARKTGQTLACNEDAIELLSRGELVGVFPEGAKGVGKHFSQRYNLDRFGRGGFVKVALEAKVPIIPVSIVGSEEIYPKIGNLGPIAKLLGAPYFPITPTFPLLGLAGLIPLPSKWIIEFGEPIDTSRYRPEAIDDRAFVLELSEQVRSTIQRTVRSNLLRRRTPFF